MDWGMRIKNMGCVCKQIESDGSTNRFRNGRAGVVCLLLLSGFL